MAGGNVCQGNGIPAGRAAEVALGNSRRRPTTMFLHHLAARVETDRLDSMESGMAAKRSQSNKTIAVQTPLGADRLLLESVQGREEISRLFRFRLTLLAEEESIDAGALLGQSISFRINDDVGRPRWFSGFVSRLSKGGRDDDFRTWVADVVPGLWFLTRTSDCKIWQQKSVLEIVQDVCGEQGRRVALEPRLRSRYDPREYCVQYRESDFAFVSRLLEQEGIGYFFEHAEGSLKTVLFDSPLSHPDCGVPAEASDQFAVRGRSGQLAGWWRNWEVRAATFAQKDYSFLEPESDLLVMAQGRQTPGADGLEIFEYPGEYQERGAGEAAARRRLEEEQVRAQTITAPSSYRQLSAGAIFRANGQRYLVTSVVHRARESYGGDGPSRGTLPAYGNVFTAIPADVPFRPSRTTPRPVISGAQPAIVVGEREEEIYPDRYGRVKVQFYWDRYGRKDENSSCWVRVSQPHAGKGYGHIDLPRVGEEVIVSFYEGDPDRPVITGRVYNADNLPPFDLPTQKTRTGIMSNTYKGKGFNEVSVDDTRDNEQVRVIAQRFLSTSVGRDESHSVTNNRTKSIGVDEQSSIGQNQTTDVKQDRKATIGNNDSTEIGKDRALSVKGNETIAIGGDRGDTVKGKESRKVEKDREVSIKGNESYSVGRNRMHKVAIAENVVNGVSRSIQTGLVHAEIIGMLNTVNTGMARVALIGKSDSTIVAGGSSFTQTSTTFTVSSGTASAFTAGTELSITSGTECRVSAGSDALITAGANIGIRAGGMLVIECPDITLKGAGGFVRVNAAGITIQGKLVKINSGGSPGSLPKKKKKEDKKDKDKEKKKEKENTKDKSDKQAESSSDEGGLISKEAAEVLKKIGDVLKEVPGLKIPNTLNKVVDALAKGELPSLSEAISMIPTNMLPKKAQKYQKAIEALQKGVEGLSKAQEAEAKAGKLGSGDAKAEAEPNVGGSGAEAPSTDEASPKKTASRSGPPKRKPKADRGGGATGSWEDAGGSAPPMVPPMPKPTPSPEPPDRPIN